MSKFNLHYKEFGESAILVEWPKEINEVILNDVRYFYHHIIGASIDGLIDCNFVYNSMLITFNKNEITHKKLVSLLKTIYIRDKNTEEFKIQTWYIPVCYNEEFGLDLSEFLEHKGIDKKELISLHTSPFYTVYGVGFLPGFLYLGGLNKELFTPRKNIHRLFVPKGSIGIGGNQTGVYPQDSPGGWQIIGKTPVPFFNVKNTIPCIFNVGDKIKFYSVSKPQYELFKIEVETEIYDFKKVIND